MVQNAPTGQIDNRIIANALKYCDFYCIGDDSAREFRGFW